MMRRFLLTVLLSAPILGLCQNPNPNAALDAFIMEEMELENIPGMATVIVKAGEIVWRKGYGLADVAGNVPVTDSTSFLLASVSKLFTGTALMQLADDGLIDLDEPINAHLPFDVVNPNHPSTAITFRMLMTHTSSIQDNEPVMDTYYGLGDPTMPLSELMERYFSPSGADYDAQNNFLNTEPGTAYEYSNIATALLGYLVERVGQSQFSEFSRHQLLEPLCMRKSSWFLSGLNLEQVALPYVWDNGQYNAVPHYGFADYPNGLLRSSVSDLANFMLMFLQQGEYSDQNLLSSEAVSEMLTPQIPSLDGTQGLNWYLEDIYLEGGGTVAVWGHNGGEEGASTDLYIDPATGIGVAVLSNAEGDNLYVVDALYNYALSLSPSGMGHPACVFVSVPEISVKETLNLYPNPTTGDVNWEGNSAGSSILSVEVYDMQGRKVLDALPSGGGSIDLSELPSGVYSLRLILDDRSSAFAKMVLMK